MQFKSNFHPKFKIRLLLELLNILDWPAILNYSYGCLKSDFDIQTNQVNLRNILTVENAITDIVYS